MRTIGAWAMPAALLAAAGPGCLSLRGAEADARLVIEAAAGPLVFTVEIADDAAERERGLMFRKSLAPDAGMLFLWPRPQEVSFWMKNTYIPLDIIFIAGDGRIVRIAADVPPHSLASVPSGAPVVAVLEVNGGRAAALGLRPGDRVRHPGLARVETAP